MTPLGGISAARCPALLLLSLSCERCGLPDRGRCLRTRGESLELPLARRG